MLRFSNYPIVHTYYYKDCHAPRKEHFKWLSNFTFYNYKKNGSMHLKAGATLRIRQ